MTHAPLYPRFAERRLIEALADTPVVLIHGPRQCGKTTLAQVVGEREGYTYLSFDDDVTLAAATADPVGFVGDLPERTILDEVQRAPGIFTALKTVVDRRRTPGRFLLTGSANVPLVPKLADSLAGRMEIQRLHPLAQSEILGREPDFLHTLFGGGFRTRTHERLGHTLAFPHLDLGNNPFLAFHDRAQFVRMSGFARTVHFWRPQAMGQDDVPLPLIHGWIADESGFPRQTLEQDVSHS